MAEPTSLYRRFRPQRFAEVRGQDFVVTALRNAVRDGTVAHAYLFSGPRGTGKTTSARLLAKALNCTDRATDGDCCDACPSCVSIRDGSSVDVIELDAASNRRIDNIRELLSNVALGSPGERKVYIVDEVHQLTNEAGTALLKTLEEPPEHVVFVLATTDPQKVSPPVRSRTQHFEFRLFGADTLGSLVHEVADKAGISLDDRSIASVVRGGKGSARDALSALEQVAAAGGVREEAPVAEAVVEALAARDAAAVLVAVAEGLRAGRDPRRLGVEVIERLRWCFLSLLAPTLVDCLDDERERIADQARQLGPAATTRAIEVLGEALVDQRESVDPRVTLEVALVRLTRADLDHSPAALAERLERLERGGATGPVPAAPRVAHAAPEPPQGRPPPAVSEPPAEAVPAEAAPAAAGPAAVRATLGSLRGTAKAAPSAQPQPAPAPAAPAPAPAAHTPAPPVPSQASPHLPPPGPAPAGAFPTRAELTKAWGDSVLPSLKPGPKSRFGTGRFITVDGEVAVFGVENEFKRKDCENRRADVEAALAAHFGRPIPLRLMVDDASAPPDPPGSGPGITAGQPSADEDVDLSALVDAPPTAATDPTSLVLEAFPGSEEMSTND